MAKCVYMPRKANIFPCTDCQNKDKSKCKEYGGKEPLTCRHCRWYIGLDKQVCHKRKGYNIRTCDEFMWD